MDVFDSRRLLAVSTLKAWRGARAAHPRLHAAALLSALFGVGTLLGLGVQRARSYTRESAATTTHTNVPGAPARLFHAPDFQFVDQHGAAFSQQTLAGHVWIADFIFTRCTSICPMLTTHLRTLQQTLDDPALRFVSFSVDPQHDTVQALRDYAELWAPDEERWALLHTEPAPLRKLVDGMHLISETSARAADTIMHTSLFFLIDGEGRVRGMYDTNDEHALERLARDVQRLAPNTIVSSSDAPFETSDAEALVAGIGAPAWIGPPIAHDEDEGVQARDPICGMTIAVQPETPHAARGGREHYFCSETCRERFVEQHPE